MNSLHRLRLQALSKVGIETVVNCHYFNFGIVRIFLAVAGCSFLLYFYIYRWPAILHSNQVREQRVV